MAGTITFNFEQLAIVDANPQFVGRYVLSKKTIVVHCEFSEHGDEFTPDTITIPARPSDNGGLSHVEYKNYVDYQQFSGSGRYAFTEGKTVAVKDMIINRSDVIQAESGQNVNVDASATTYYDGDGKRPVNVTGTVNLTYKDQNNKYGYRPSSDNISVYSNDNKFVASGITPFSVNWGTDESDYVIGNVEGSSPYYDYEIVQGGGKVVFTDFDGKKYPYLPGTTNEKIEVVATLKKGFSGYISWNDFGNYSQIRPSSVTVKLYRNGSYTTSKSVSGSSTGSTWNVNFPALGGDDDTIYTMTVDEFPEYVFAGNSGTGSSTIVATHVPRKHFTLKMTGNGNYGGYSYQLTRWYKDLSGSNDDHREIIDDKPFTAEGGSTIDLGTYDVKGGSTKDPWDIHYSLAILQDGSTQPQPLDIKTAHDTPQSTEWVFEVIDTPKQNVGRPYKGMLPKIGSTFGIVNLGKDPIYVQLQEINFVTGEVALATNDSISLMK